METKVCVVCKEIKDINKFTRNPDGSIRKHACMACYGKKDRARLKLDAIAAFGRKCQCCGENHPYFLSLDHIKNDGNTHRESLNEQQIYREARREGWPKDKYQMLCMNCNFAKGHFKECPHKAGITADMALEKLNSLCFALRRQYVSFENQYTIGGKKLDDIKSPDEVLKAFETLNISPEKLIKLLTKRL